MTPTPIMMCFIAGGSLVSIATLLARTRYPALAGIAMLFPAVTLVGMFFAGQTVDTTQLKEITKFSMYALSTTFIFLLVFYYAQNSMSVPKSLMVATTSWLISAVALTGITRL